MLAMTDTPIERFLPTFAEAGIQVAFLVPTPTGFEKSIMDATSPVRELLKSTGLHDYEAQEQGPENKVVLQSYFVHEKDIEKTSVSLYRPVTKKGDPRIWFHNLKSYCKPRNLLALIVLARELYVINLSEPTIADSLLNRGQVYAIIQEAKGEIENVAEELLKKLRAIHSEGFLRSITPGDPGVGDTLENALGISRNNLPLPDYKGIELKASRLTRGGVKRSNTRQTLFAKVPDEGMTYRQLLETFGKIQTPKREGGIERLQLECTLRASKPNTFDLQLFVDSNADRLRIIQNNGILKKNASAWILEELKRTLSEKHKETFWIKAQSEYQDGIEYFRYDKVLHTKSPNVSLLSPLLETDIVSVDLLAHLKPDGKFRDHGVLFKIFPKDMIYLFGEPTEYVL